MHTIITKSFKIVIVAPTCFGLNKPSSESCQPVLRQSYKVDMSYTNRYLKLSVLWLRVNRALYARSKRITGLNKICKHKLQITICVTHINIVTLAKHDLRAP